MCGIYLYNLDIEEMIICAIKCSYNKLKKKKIQI